MTRPGGVAFHRALCCVLAAFATSFCCAQDAPFSILDRFDPLQATVARGDVLSTLQPIVRQFNFDDGQTGPNALPPNFYRYVAPSQGFPPFGEMSVRPGAGFDAANPAAGASAALEFSLAGGSMSARIGTSVIPVLPYADYVVACRVRTLDLRNAQARLAAWLCDASGRVIPGSRVESRPANAANRWDTVSLEIHGDYADAADLVFELLLVQPPQRLEQAAIDPQPTVQDVRGFAWFDDLTVSHMPRVVLAMTQSGQSIQQDQSAQFAVQVNELASKNLTARLRVIDMNGSMVHDQSFPAPRGREPSLLSVPMHVCGWYRAVLDVSSNEQVSRRRWTDFVVLPSESRRSIAEPPFGVTFSHPAAAADALNDAAMAAQMRAGLALVPAWDVQSTIDRLPALALSRRTMIEQLLRSDVDVAFALPGVPEELARAAGSQARTALSALSGDPKHWRPYVDDLLMHFGLTIDRWVIGSSDDLADADGVAALRQLEVARQALAGFVPSPNVHVAWPIERQPPGDAEPSSVALRVPSTIAASSITDFLEPWMSSPSRACIVSLDLLPASEYAPRQRLVDSMLRGLHAWRAGAKCVVTAQPWRSQTDDRRSVVPDIVFAGLRTLNLQLAGRRFVSELALGPDVHVWAVAGEDSSDAAVIAWCDRDASSGTTGIDIQLADRDVRLSDALGNRDTIGPVNGMHHIELNELPVFIDGVSLELVLFRSGVTIEPAFVPAASKVHEHEIVIHNPWDSAVAGTLRLTTDPELQITPSVQDFAIAANGETRLPIQIVPQRGILAGPRTIAAEININADRLHTLQMDLAVDVGLKDIEITAAWSTVRNPTTGALDLLVSPAVTNRSDKPVNLDVDLLAEGVSQMRRTIAALQPGQSQTRTFRIANGAKLLAGKPIRLGVAQRDGVARLNKIIVIGGNDRREGDAIAGAPTSP